MTTSVDICNRALQIAAARATITALNDGSNEANNCNLIYTDLVNWCFSVANWNFARKTAVLTLSKAVPGTPTTWSSIYPAPPWLYQYLYPSDAVRVQFVASQALTAAANTWAGLPSKFAISMDTIASVQTRVILTNEVNALATYTAIVSDPTQWPAYFSQAVICTLAWVLSGALSGSAELEKFLLEVAEQHMTLAVTINRNEGIIIDDTTPEWTLARGVPYPTQRPQPSAAVKKEAQHDNRR